MSLNKIIIIFMSVFIMVLVLRLHNVGKVEHHNVYDTIIVEYIDTVIYEHIVPKESICVKHVVERVQIADTLVVESIKTVYDSVNVVLPISQHIYKEKDYTAYISGYKACLDSIHIYKQTSNTYIKNKNRWSVGIGCGLGLSGRGIEPYLGLSLHYRLFDF